MAMAKVSVSEQAPLCRNCEGQPRMSQQHFGGDIANRGSDRRDGQFTQVLYDRVAGQYDDRPSLVGTGEAVPAHIPAPDHVGHTCSSCQSSNSRC